LKYAVRKARQVGGGAVGGTLTGLAVGGGLYGIYIGVLYVTDKEYNVDAGYGIVIGPAVVGYVVGIGLGLYL